MWETEKMLVTNIFSFSHNVFYPLRDKFYHFPPYLIFCLQNAFNLDHFETFCSQKLTNNSCVGDEQDPVNSSTNDKFLDWFKLKTFADDKTNVPKNLKFVFGRVENIVGKRENTGYQHFFLFPQGFQKSSPSGP